ncbi:MAG TPA: hypothetical protein VGN74_05570 [Brevundimonas sp.]|jgi:hypothetical protein|uniref:hypothetical protein n=1 Tax=Brevundimonas sp. TaxID=1871086 RepID=UPI002E0EB2E6|nr:hypothetical protein [Brevundimonas sp.]
MSKIVLFPSTRQAEATAYKDAANAHYQANIEPGTDYAYIRNDAFGQWAVPYYGEVVNGLPFEEPASMVPLRAEGVLVDGLGVVWSFGEE